MKVLESTFMTKKNNNLKKTKPDNEVKKLIQTMKSKS